MLIRYAVVDDDGELYVHVDECPLFKYMTFTDRHPYYWAEREGFVCHFYCDRVDKKGDLEICIPIEGTKKSVRLCNPYPSRPSIFNKLGFRDSVACTFVEHDRQHVKGALLMDRLNDIRVTHSTDESRHDVGFKSYDTSTDRIFVPVKSKVLVPSFSPPYGNPRLSHWDRFHDQGEELDWDDTLEQRATTTNERL